MAPTPAQWGKQASVTQRLPAARSAAQNIADIKAGFVPRDHGRSYTKEGTGHARGGGAKPATKKKPAVKKR